MADVKEEADFSDDVQEVPEGKILYVKYKCFCPVGGCAYARGKKVLHQCYGDAEPCWSRVRHHMFASSHHLVPEKEVDKELARYSEEEFINTIREYWTPEEVEAWEAESDAKQADQDHRLQMVVPKVKTVPRPPAHRPPPHVRSRASLRSRSRSPRDRHSHMQISQNDMDQVNALTIPVDLKDQIKQQTVNAMAFVRAMSNAVKCLRGCARFCEQAQQTYIQEADSIMSLLLLSNVGCCYMLLCFILSV